MPRPSLRSLHLLSRLLASSSARICGPPSSPSFLSSWIIIGSDSSAGFFSWSQLAQSESNTFPVSHSYGCLRTASTFSGSSHYLKEIDALLESEPGETIRSEPEGTKEEGALEATEAEDFYIEDGGECLLEDAEPQPDRQGRSYLHVLSVEEVCKILDKLRAEDVEVLPVRDLCEWTDHLIIASAHSTRHMRGVADSIVFEVKKRSSNIGPNLYPTVEGRDSDQWMVVDCGSVVVHVFREDVRSYYNLEELWRRKKTASLTE